MSDDEDNTNFYGTALPELPNDVIPTRKPITVADQIAVDANGKRRFHGAFTGGFSAGYWNTVGSQEGWKPKEFKSSRTEKASRVQQNPNDFMDEEDCGEFGINPQRIQTTTDFTAGDANSAERGAGADAAAANPMLNLFLMPAKDRASVALLKRMGWRENKDGKSYRSHSARKTQVKVYQCSMGPFESSAGADNKENDDDADKADANDSDASCESVTFNPDDFEAMAHAPKTNRFGLGYRGLIGSDRSTSLEQTSAGRHVNLFAPSFEVVDRKTQKKLTVRGQAFGVGAFEEDDDDIYALDDMSTYSFEQPGAKRSRDQTAALHAAPVKYHQTIAGFKPADAMVRSAEKRVYTVSMPRDFRPRNWLQRRTRFEPRRDAPAVAEAPGTAAGMGRHMLTPDQRGQLLGAASAKVQPAVLPLAAKTVATAAAKPVAEMPSRAKQMLESFESRFVSTAASTPAPIETLKTGLQNVADLRLAEQLYNKQFVSADPPATLESKSARAADADSLPMAAKPATDAYAVHMTRELIAWVPCPLLYQKMNIEDPSRALAGSKAAAAAPFSLMKHVNPLFRTGRRNEKEFTMASSSSTEPEVVPNAYVPKVTTPTISATPPAGIEMQKDVMSRPEVAAAAIVKVVSQRPKTELEQSISKAANAHPSEKKDIFKAIFESSDDEEDDDNNAADKDQRSPYASTDDPIPSGHRVQSLPSAAITANILRNTSPPRGIFSTLSKMHSFSSSADRSAPKSQPVEESVSAAPDVYGPTLPSLRTPTTIHPPLAAERRPAKRSNDGSTDSSDSDEWIVAADKPADNVHGNGDRHRKKHKKDKSRHKDKKSKKSKKCKKDKKHRR